MKKRLRKKKVIESVEEYRGIRMVQGWAGKYTHRIVCGETNIMILFPTIEGYARDFTHARKIIDTWWSSAEAYRYRHERKNPEVFNVPF